MAPGIIPETAPPNPARPKNEPTMPPTMTGSRYPDSAKPMQRTTPIAPSRNVRLSS